MSSQMSLWDTPNVISSPEFPDGPTPLDWLDGETIASAGQDHAPVSLFPTPEKNEDLMTPVISGPCSTGLLESASLQSCLESKLRAKLVSTGSTLYTLTWKTRVTPSGRQICARRASVPRTRDKDSISWVTPNARDYRDLSTTRGYLAQRKRHSPSVATRLLELGGNWKQVPQAYRALMGFPCGWHEGFCMDMETRSYLKLPKRSSKVTSKPEKNSGWLEELE